MRIGRSIQLIMTEAKCDFCGTKELEKVYTPKGTRRGLSVYTCPLCGLVQSLPRIDHVEDKTISTSGDADWGNVRYGKQFRAKFAVDTLSRYVNRFNLNHERMNVLDVGAGKGNFISAFSYRHRMKEVTLVEPDKSLKPEEFGFWREGIDAEMLDWIDRRFEDIGLPFSHFDVVHCSHTLEHMKSPMATLKKIWDAMIMGGLLFIEVPNIEIIGSTNFIEEFFIDKHLYHFSYSTLAKYLRWSDFEIVEANISQENISVVAEKVEYTILDRREKLRDKQLLDLYAAVKDLRPLFAKQQAERINRLAKEKRVIIWGAGRIFDLMLKAGLNREALGFVVDKYLPDITRPNELQEAEIGAIDLLIIASREYAKEIEQEARGLGFECEVKVWSELE